jgi:hypothetical protein
MELFQPPPPPAERSARTVKRLLISTINAELVRRVHTHIDGVRLFWKSECTPDELVEELGTDAGPIVEASRANLRNLSDLAELVGLTLNNLMHPEDYLPPREITVNADGTVTLAPPAEGFDAWGNPILSS